MEKQKIKALYGISERQFARYIHTLLARQKSGEDSMAKFAFTLERRLGNVVYRMGFASSRTAARQLVSHGHFSVNGRRVTIPSYALRISDIAAVRPESRGNAIWKESPVALKEYTPPPWLQVDKEKLEGKIISMPRKEDLGEAVNFQTVFEFYAR